MKTFFYILVIYFMALVPCFAQISSKPSLDTTVFRHWPQLKNQAIISPDGKTVVYALATQGNNAQDNKLVVASVKGSWKKTFDTDKIRAEFNPAATHAVAAINGDSIALVSTRDGQVSFIKGVSMFRVLGDLLYYQLRVFPKKLVVVNLENQKKTEYDNLSRIVFQTGSQELFLVESNQGKTFLKLAGAKGINPEAIWKGDMAEGIIYNPVFSDWTFYGENGNERGQYLWDTKKGLRKVKLVAPANGGIDYAAMKPVRTYEHGKWMVLKRNIVPTLTEATGRKSSLLTIWNFQGTSDNGKSGVGIGIKDSFFILNTLSGEICPYSIGTNERIVQLEGDFALIDRTRGDGDFVERYWNRYAGTDRYLLHLTNGKCEKLSGEDFRLGNSGKLLLGYDWDTKTYQVMETTGLKTLFRAASPADLFRINIFWMDEVRAVMYQDDYDVWKFDPVSPQAPSCLTGQYGRKTRTILSVLNNLGLAILKKQQLYLTAQEENTRANGFYRVDLKGGKQPEKLFFGDFSLGEPSRNGEYWTWKQSFAEKAPDLLVSKDLEHFDKLEMPKPESGYNWLRTELHHYKLKDGRIVEGILYKPENFNVNKKYPLILYYYQRLPDWLHSYPEVSSSTGPINVPWLVSNGCLVFVPDIINETNRSMASATDCILAAHDYLNGLSFVDLKKIGITGHSFGGYTTLSTITRTGVFAAAFASSPPSSAFSSYYSVPGAFGQMDITSLPWEDSACYVDNSPIFSLHKVTTPLLIMGNRGDELWPQPMEFFYGLRRLGKPAWMLEYFGQGHGISGYAEIDRTLRVQQFFDYYLKNSPCPEWMSIPGSSGLAPTTKHPDKGILSLKAEEQAKKLTEKKDKQ